MKRRAPSGSLGSPSSSPQSFTSYRLAQFESSGRPKRCRFSADNDELSHLRGLLNETNERLARETALRVLLEHEVTTSWEALHASRDLAVTFQEVSDNLLQYLQSESDHLKRAVAEWEAWGLHAKVVLQQFGLLGDDMNAAIAPLPPPAAENSAAESQASEKSTAESVFVVSR